METKVRFLEMQHFTFSVGSKTKKKGDDKSLAELNVSENQATCKSFLADQQPKTAQKNDVKGKDWQALKFYMLWPQLQTSRQTWTCNSKCVLFISTANQVYTN